MSHVKSAPFGVYNLDPQDRHRLVAGVEALMAFGPRLIAEVLLEVSDRDVEGVLCLLDGYARIAPFVAVETRIEQRRKQRTAPDRPWSGEVRDAAQ